MLDRVLPRFNYFSPFIIPFYRVTIKPEKLDEFSESVAEFMQRNKLKIDLPLVCRPRMLGPSLQTPCTEFVAKELRTPEVDLLFRYIVLLHIFGPGHLCLKSTF